MRQVTLPAIDLAELTCRRFVLSPQAQKHLTPGVDAETFLTRLVNAPLPGDAIQFLAYHLPKRHAVWWGCLAVGRTNNMAALPPAEEAALEVAVKWVLEPDEVHRRAAELTSGMPSFSTPAGHVARAAFFSGGSINPPGLPVMEPSENVTPRMIAGTLFLIASRAPATERLVFERLLVGGIAVWKNRVRWD